jgi:hypothetical protein
MLVENSSSNFYDENTAMNISFNDRKYHSLINTDFGLEQSLSIVSKS